FIDPYHPWPFQETVSFVMPAGGVVEDFMGVKVGDLNRSVQANLQGIVPRSDLRTALTLEDRTVEAGDEFTISVALGDGRMQWSGAQWSLQLDGLALSQIASEREDLVEDMWYAVGNEIRLAWTAAEATEAGPLVTLSLRALTSGRVSEMITLAEEQLT